MAVTSSDAFKVQLAHVIVIELASSLSPSLPRVFRQVVAALAAAYAGPCGLSSSCGPRDLRLFVCLPPPSPTFFFFCARFKGNLGAVNKFWHLIIFCGFVRRIYLCVPQWRRSPAFSGVSFRGSLASGGSAPLSLSQLPWQRPLKCRRAHKMRQFALFQV